MWSKGKGKSCTDLQDVKRLHRETRKGELTQGSLSPTSLRVSKKLNLEEP